MKLTPRIATMSGPLGARRSRSPLALGATLCASVALLLGIATPTASAATPIDSYGYFTTFGDGTGLFYEAQVNAVAIDSSTGNIFVAESVANSGFGEPTVQIYSADSAVGGIPLTSVFLPNILIDVAVDQSDGSMYVLYQGGGVARYLSDGAPVPTYTLDPSFEAPPHLFSSGGEVAAGLAVDPVTHDVLASDRGGGRVYRLDATGALVSTNDGSTTSKGAFSQRLGSLATGPTGTAYVVDEGSGRVEGFSSADEPLGKLPIPSGGAPSVVAVNPQNGEVAVLVNLHGRTFIEGFTASGQPTFSSRIPPQAFGSPIGLAWDPGTDRLYLHVNAGSTGYVHTFVPMVQPGIDPPIVSQVTPTAAHVTTNVASGGELGETTTGRVEYCPATAACVEFPDSEPSEPGQPSNPWLRLPEHELTGAEVTIEDDITGLDPNSSYLVRASADRLSSGGVPTYGTSTSTTFQTPLIPPATQTGAAGAITASQAELNGTIATYGDQTIYHFEYGQTTSYGSSAPAGAEGVAGNARATRTFSRTITGLQPGTTYHYRLVAHNSAGTTEGADRTFTTLTADELPPARAYEQVTPTDKRGATLSPFGFQAAADGSGIAYSTLAASTDSSSAPLTPRFLSRRGASDWTDWQPLDPPQNVARQIVGTATQAISADFTHALVISNRVLAPGALEGGGNVYVFDLDTNTYSLVGAAAGLAAYGDMTGAVLPNMYLQGAPDFSWVVFASKPPLLPGVKGAALYKWTEGGGLELESRLPNGGIPAGSITMQGKGVLSTREASDDGNTMAFAIGVGSPGAGVYLRANGQTTAISISHIPGDPSTPLPGEIDGISRDGRYAIFRSVRLTPDAPPVVEGFPQGAAVDLYQYDSVTDVLTFIGTVNASDQGRVIGVSSDGQTVYYNHRNPPADPLISDTVVWRHGASQTVTTEHPDQGDGMGALPSPNGRFLVYYGNDGDAHLYDADTEETFCVSCRPDGSSGKAGVPTLSLGFRDLSNRAMQVLTDDGTVFFDTTLPLLPADRNGTRDVYSFRGGHLTLISPGDGNFVARFGDATPDGSSVFFTTNEPLVSRDTNQSQDVYVSRIGGGFSAQSPPAPPATCARSECAEVDSGPLGSPPVGSSASQPPAKPKKHCPKGTHARKAKGKARCVKPSKGKKKAKRANTNRRQGR